jgi:hypothetical protein
VDATADLFWRPADGWEFQAGAFGQQGSDWFLPRSSAGSPLAVDTAVRSFRLLGGTLSQRWQAGAWEQSFKLTVQEARIPDLPGEWATYLPAWTAAASLGYRQGIYHARLGADLLGPRQAAGDGSLPMEPRLPLRPP